MRIRTILLALILLPGLVALYAFGEAREMPVVREATIGLPDWPKGAKPMAVVLIADIHIGSAAMDRGRLSAIVDRINALHPDLVLIAGDLIYGHHPEKAAKVGGDLSAALARLKPGIGTVAVLGNHDLWTGQDAVRGALTRAGIVVLQNQAIERGPIAIAGIADAFTHQADIAKTWAELATLPGAHIALSHSPDIDRAIPADTSLLLAGHSHCGQVVLPFYGAVTAVTRDYNPCGLYHKGSLSIVVTGGLGASGVPFRFNAPPDLWLLHLGPAR